MQAGRVRYRIVVAARRRPRQFCNEIAHQDRGQRPRLQRRFTYHHPLHGGVGRRRGVGRDRGVALGVAVAVGVGLGVSVAVGVAVGVTVGVTVGLTVGVTEGVGVGVHDDRSAWHPITLTVSTRQPSLEPLLSLAIRQRSLTSKSPTPGSSTTLVMKPSELPLQARRPAIGLPRSALIVRLYPPSRKLSGGTY